jgi:hypothetical protein
MSNSPRKETRRERKRRQLGEFVGHLLTSKTIDEAASKVGVSSRSATRWLRTEEFRSVYVEHRQATLQNVATMLRQSSVGAVEALAAVIKDPDAPATAKTNAAKSILDSMLRVIETQEIESRLKALEEIAQAGEQ